MIHNTHTHTHTHTHTCTQYYTIFYGFQGQHIIENDNSSMHGQNNNCCYIHQDVIAQMRTYDRVYSLQAHGRLIWQKWDVYSL